MKARDEYLIGLLSVYYDGGENGVELYHRVDDRFSVMELGEGDHIEIQDGLVHEVITIKQALETLKKDSKSYPQREAGQSLYHGVKARVKINKKTTKYLENKKKEMAMREIFKEVDSGSLSSEDAMQIIIGWDNEV